MSNLLVPIVDGAFHSLDLVEHLDALGLVILDGTFDLFQVTT